MTKHTYPQLVVIYHSAYGHTQRVAEAIKVGAETHVNALSMSVTDIDWETLERAEMLVFGSPVYMGSVTAEFKTFMDATSKLWFERRWLGKWAAGFANSGGLSGDKLAVLQQIMIYAMQHGMNWAGMPLMPTGNEATDLNRLSGFLGLMTQSDNADAAVTPPQGDIDTALWWGEHLASLLLRQPPQQS